jgi:hypothetical protein
MKAALPDKMVREGVSKDSDRKVGKFKEDRVKKLKVLSVNKEKPVKFIIRRDKLVKSAGEETPVS